MKFRKNLTDIFTYLFLALIAFVTVVPRIYVFSCSFKTNMEIFKHADKLLPMNPTFDNFRQLFEAEVIDIVPMIWNSIYYTVLCVTITLVTGALQSYAFERYEFWGKHVIFGFFTALMFVVLGGITIHPQFEVLGKLGLATSINGLIFMKCFGMGMMNVWLIRSFMAQLPKELDESAMIDGCGYFGIFFRIILPLLAPMLATVGLLAFNGSWNEYLMPTMFTITRPDQHTLIVGLMAIMNSGEGAANWNLVMAGAVVTILPVLIAYIFFNRFFIDGMTAGAVKG